MQAVVTGMIATYPVGGMAWDYGQYAIGLENLGFDVYYLEDTGLESYHHDPPGYLSNCLRSMAPQLQHRWHYQPPYGDSSGMATEEIADLIAGADLFLNVSGGCLMRDAYMRCRCKVLVDTDPGLNQFVNYPKWDRNPGWQGTHGYRGHDFFFSYAENFGVEGCKLPDLGLEWHPTRPPVALDCWKPVPSGERWTTVMSWNPYRHYDSAIEYEGQIYGAKEMEFARVETLPSLVTPPMEIAVGGEGAPLERWRQMGWRTLEATTVSSTADAYRDYIQQSRGEFSVAKNIYVDTHCGWFSCRSVCYLAAGRPVVLQDTGYARHIPTGEGLLRWTTVDEARKAIEDVESDYQTHQRRAREIAEKYFSAERVVQDMLRITQP